MVIFNCAVDFHALQGTDMLASDGNGILQRSRKVAESLHFILEGENSCWILILLIRTAYFTATHVHFLNVNASITGSLKLLKLALQGCEATA